MIEMAYILHLGVFLIITFIYFKKCNPSAFSPLSIYLLFYFLVFVFRPFMVLFFGFDHGWWYMRYYPTDVGVLKSLFVISLSLVVFFVTFTLSSKRCKPNFENVRKFNPKVSYLDVLPFIIMSVVVLPMGVYSTIMSIGGIHSDSVGMVFIDGIRVHTQNTGYLVDAKNMLFSYSILTIFVFKFRIYSFIPLLIFISHRAFEGYGRWGIILSIISSILVYLYFNRKHWPPRKFLIAIPFVFILFNAIGHNRDAIRGLFEEVSVSHNVYESEGFNSLDTLDFANFDYVTFIVNTIPEETGSYRYGAQYLQLFTEPIPRVLWKGKPLGEPIKFYDLNNHGNFLGLSYSLVGDGWSSGGYVGVIMTLFIIGLVLGKYYLYFCKNVDNVNKVLIYFLVYPVLIQLYRDGGISIFKFLLFILIPVFLYNLSKKFVLRRSP